MIKWIILWYQKVTFNNVFSFQEVLIIHLLIRCYKTRFFLWNTNNNDRNGVSKENKHTHTKHSKKRLVNQLSLIFLF